MHEMETLCCRVPRENVLHILSRQQFSTEQYDEEVIAITFLETFGQSEAVRLIERAYLEQTESKQLSNMVLVLHDLLRQQIHPFCPQQKKVL